MTRRDLIKATGATAAASVIAIDVFPRTAEARSLLAATPTFSASALRPADMLAVRFDFYNLTRDKKDKGDLVRVNAVAPAYIVASLGYGNGEAPQNIAEQAFLETAPALSTPPPAGDATAGEPLAAPGTVQARLAARTRLAFRVPDTTLSIPFTTAALLDVAQFTMSVAPTALPPGAQPAVPPTMRAPNETETALELPWHLTMSPHSGSTWAHASQPVVRNGRTELWHSRLAVRKPSPLDATKFYADELDAAMRTLRAIWADGFDRSSAPSTGDESPFRMSLKKLDRWQLVRLTSDFDLPPVPAPQPPKYWPRPIDVDRLMLSALGAWQTTRGFFTEPPPGFNLGEWKHIATMARDQYVKVVYLGWLLPFRHPAALIKVTERKIQPVPASTDRGAYLRQRFFIVVRQPVVTYPEASPQPDGGRQMPYKTVEIKTTVTPTLNDPADSNWDFESKKDLAFFPVVGGQVFPFNIVGTDRDGQKSEFTLPLVFVSYPVLGNLTDPDIAKIVDDYDKGQRKSGTPFDAAFKTAQLSGQKVGIAPSTKSAGVVGGKPGDTAVEMKSVNWSAKPPMATVPFGEAPWFPVWTEAAVRLNGVEQVKGGSLDPTVIQPHPKYVLNDYDSSEVFAQLKTNVSLSFTDPSAPSVDRAGGLVNPDMSIGGLSRKLGPVGGDVKALIPAKFDPKDFFKGAKILGGIKLEDIVEVVEFAGGEIPKLNTNTIYPGGDTTQPPQALETTFHFVPDLKKDPLGVFDPVPSATMTMDALFRTPILPPGEPTYEIVGDLRDFKVNLLGDNDISKLIVLSFNQLKFTTRNGKKPHIDVDIRDVEFVGILAFVQTLKDFLKIGGTGPSIDITPTSVTAGFAIPIPTVGVGILTIQNIAFGASLTIPFTGKPARVRFNFSEREDPFLVTVIGLGGGGFFAIALGLDGLEVLEMSIEVGASVALNLGVASGEVHALAGLYFKLERIAAVDGPPPVAEHDQASLTGYVRLGGSVDVLGIVSVSIELYLGLTYEFSPANELWGQATLTIEVEVLMFSKTFEFSVEKRIPGPDLSGSAAQSGMAALGGTGAHVASLAAKKKADAFDFTDLVSEDEWDQYAAAFATS